MTIKHTTPAGANLFEDFSPGFDLGFGDAGAPHVAKYGCSEPAEEYHRRKGS